MFEGELLADNMQMTFVLEESYHKAQIDWVFCDPVRLTQVFINLLTNVSLSCSPYSFVEATNKILGHQVYAFRNQKRDNGQPRSITFETSKRIGPTYPMVPIKGFKCIPRPDTWTRLGIRTTGLSVLRCQRHRQRPFRGGKDKVIPQIQPS